MRLFRICDQTICAPPKPQTLLLVSLCAVVYQKLHE